MLRVFFPFEIIYFWWTEGSNWRKWIQCVCYKPVQILQKTADGWSFPGQAAWLPLRSFWSSSHKPAKQQMIMLHTYIRCFALSACGYIGIKMKGNRINSTSSTLLFSSKLIASLLLFPCDLLICFIAYDLSWHGKNVFMWRSNQRLTRPLITTCCTSRLHSKWDNLLFPIQINGCDPQQPQQIN